MRHIADFCIPICQIYELCFPERQHYPSYHPLKEYGWPPSITRVCRQMRNESLPRYYAANSFEKVVRNYDFARITRSCEALREFKVNSIRVSLRVSSHDHEMGIRCGEGLWTLFKWQALTNQLTQVNRDMQSRHGSSAPVNLAFMRATDCYVEHVTDETELRTIFDAWLHMLDLHCRCPAAQWKEAGPGGRWYCCSRPY